MKTFLLFLIALGVSLEGFSTESIPAELKNVGIFERLGDQVGKDIPFTDHNGKRVLFGDYFQNGKPTVLLLVYFGCPNICNYFLKGAVETLKEAKWQVGKEYNVVAVSFDHRESHDLAAAARLKIIEMYGRGASPDSDQWPFLVGDENSVKRLTESVGFRFRFEESTQEYAHSSAMIFLTPKATVSRYLHGMVFAQKDLRLALVEAGEGQIGSLSDRFLLFCFKYDPKANKYALFAMRLMQTGALLTLMIILTAYVFVFRKYRRGVC